jgi:hypothetical protein
VPLFKASPALHFRRFEKAKLSYSHRHFDVSDALKGVGERKGAKMTDHRRYGVIGTRRINPETYHLTINGELWSEVEWSHKRQRWCVQDAAGRCLTHVEHIVGQDKDPQAAIRLAKRMIVDGRMPSPQEALAQLRQRSARKTKAKTKKPKPLGQLIVGDITAASEAVLVDRK